MTPAAQRGPLRDFRLGEWLVQPSLNRLCREERIVHFRPKVMDVLVCLAEQAGEVISKEAIIEAVWAKEFIADSTFSRVIFELREALGDDSQVPRFIETIPKRGYRLLVPVEFADGAAVAGLLSGEEPRRSRRVWLLLPLVGLALVAIGQALLRNSGHGGRDAPQTSPSASIAVLSFENLGSPADEYFAAGVTDEIVGRLAAVGGLRVVSRSATQPLPSVGRTIAQVGSELGVDYVLRGTVRWDRDSTGNSRVRITPTLVRAADEAVIWSETYDRRVDDILEVQSEISRSVIAQLRVALGDTERVALEAVPEIPFEAYQAYLRGTYHTHRPDFSPASLRLAAQMFERAATLAPTYARAWAELARAQARLASLGGRGHEIDAQRAQQALDRALVLGPHDPDVRVASALVSYWCYRDYQRAHAELEAARDLGARPEDLREPEAWVFRRQGRWDEALERLLALREADPGNAQVLLELGGTCFHMRRYAAAESFFEELIASAPDETFAYLFKAWSIRCRTGSAHGTRAVLDVVPGRDVAQLQFAWFWQELYERRFAEALDRVAGGGDEVVRLACECVSPEVMSGMALSLQGRRDAAAAQFEKARQVLEAATGREPVDRRRSSALGLALSGLGRHQEAIRKAEHAVEACPLALDAIGCMCPRIDLALVLTMAGDFGGACDRLDEILGTPGPLSVPLLRLDPRWQPLTSQPCFAVLTAKYPEGGRIF